MVLKYTHIPTFISDLPAPDVDIFGSTIGTAGEHLTLNCSVTTVEHLLVLPIVQWSGGTMTSSDSVSQSETTYSGVTSIRTLEFNPLTTSHGAEYMCQAELNIVSTVNINRSGNDSRVVIIQSKSLPYCLTV